jgi:hypothetical protein
MDLPLYLGVLAAAFGAAFVAVLGAALAAGALVARVAVFLPFAARVLPPPVARLEREAELAALVVNGYPISAGNGTESDSCNPLNSLDSAIFATAQGVTPPPGPLCAHR